VRSYKLCHDSCSLSRFGCFVLFNGAVFSSSSGFIRRLFQFSYLSYQQVSLVGECDCRVDCVGLSSEMVVAACPPSCHNISRCFCGAALPVVFRAAHSGIFGICELVPLIHAG